MRMKYLLIPLLGVLAILLVVSSCSPEMDEEMRERTDMGMDNMTLARDKSLDSVVVSNIESDLILRWYALTYGIKVEVSRRVATVYMKVRTEEQRDTAIGLAKNTKDIQEVIDEIVVDPTLDTPPFEL